jgi:hypothetical protein
MANMTKNLQWKKYQLDKNLIAIHLNSNYQLGKASMRRKFPPLD